MRHERTIDPATGAPGYLPADGRSQHMHRAAAKARVEWIADLLDTRFKLPVLGYRFGWDSILGLIPGVGDAATAMMSAYLIWEARRAGAGAGLIVRMVYNVLIDMILGAVPLFGDIFDFAFKANRINAQLLNEHFQSIQQRDG